MSFDNAEGGFVDLDGLDDVKEPEVVDQGDYAVEIIRAEHTESKAGNPMTKVTFKILDSNSVNPKLFSEFLLHVSPDDDDQTANSKKLKFKRLIECFGVELIDGRLDIAMLPGLTGNVTLGLSEATEKYEASNRIVRWHKR